MERALTASLAVWVVFGMGVPASAYAQANEPGPPKIIHRTNPHGVGLSAPAGSTTATSPILNHGGPIILTPTIYIIWYGNWNQSNGSDTPAGQQIVHDFAGTLGGSPYFTDINGSYGVAQALLAKETTDSYSRGTRLRDADVQLVVTSAISSGRLPYDANGVYFVLSSSDVSELSGFCKMYCGWHTAATPTVGHIRYAFVGNPNRCLNACAIQTVGPNGNAGVDAMVSVIAHELDEAASDPDLNAWYDKNGSENADKCAWTFGHAQYQVANGAWANLPLGSRNYLIQRNLFHNLLPPNGPVGDYCMMDGTQN